MVPTASLAAILVYTGYKLVNVQNVKRLPRYGGAPVVIYAATVIGIVGMDLLKGILLGLALPELISRFSASPTQTAGASTCIW
jgi:MFS superfamily sulfate permease-like transporter